jgi:hypothetical protein
LQTQSSLQASLDGKQSAEVELLQQLTQVSWFGYFSLFIWASYRLCFALVSGRASLGTLMPFGVPACFLSLLLQVYRLASSPSCSTCEQVRAEGESTQKQLQAAVGEKLHLQQELSAANDQLMLMQSELKLKASRLEAATQQMAAAETEHGAEQAALQTQLQCIAK